VFDAPVCDISARIGTEVLDVVTGFFVGPEVIGFLESSPS
jgi:hypothetical protein